MGGRWSYGQALLSKCQVIFPVAICSGVSLLRSSPEDRSSSEESTATSSEPELLDFAFFFLGFRFFFRRFSTEEPVSLDSDELLLSRLFRFRLLLLSLLEERPVSASGGVRCSALANKIEQFLVGCDLAAKIINSCNLAANDSALANKIEQFLVGCDLAAKIRYCCNIVANDSVRSMNK
jgi:hypothetical protein